MLELGAKRCCYGSTDIVDCIIKERTRTNMKKATGDSLRKLLDLLIEEVGTQRYQQGEADNSRKRVCDLLAEIKSKMRLTQAAFAAKLGVHVNTIRRWSSGEIPIPEAKVGRFGQHLGLEQEDKTVKLDCRGDVSVLGGVHVAIKSSSFLIDQEKYCDKIWVLRSNTSFWSGYPGSDRSKMVENLQQGIEYRFLYLDKPQTVETNEVFIDFNKAKWSHDSFRRFLWRRDKREKSNLLNLIKGWAIDEKDYQVFSLGAIWTNMALFLYNETYVQEYEREFDIFVEIPVAAYDSNDPERIASKGATAWIQLSPIVSAEVFDLWKTSLQNYESKQPFHRIKEEEEEEESNGK